MYLLRENEIFPAILLLPTSSNKEFSKYIKRLLSKGKKSSNVVTKFSLKKAVNKTGISYSQEQFAMERALTPNENELVGKISEQVKVCWFKIGTARNFNRQAFNFEFRQLLVQYVNLTIPHDSWHNKGLGGNTLNILCGDKTKKNYNDGMLEGFR